MNSWARPGEIFDGIASDLIRAEVPADVKGRVLRLLYASLRASGWSTTDQSLTRFRDDPVIVGVLTDEQW